MTFKEQQSADLSALFNVGEFAQMHILDGKSVAIILDDDRLQDIKAKSQYADAIYSAEKLVLVRRDEWGIIPAVGQMVNLDDDIYRVLDVKGDDLLEVMMEAVR